MEVYKTLLRYYGPTGWWPGDTPFEIAVGAILTQNTAWSNVERAIENLKRSNILTPFGILSCKRDVLEEAIRPSGYFRQKAERLIIFCRYLVENYAGKIELMSKKDTVELRKELLSIKGIGEETADDILLYACGHPIFVVDAYTRRIFSRHGLINGMMKYGEIQKIFHKNVTEDVQVYKEYHGLIVWTGKQFCRKRPKCEGCPLDIYPKNFQMT
ncbi:MAG: endonuclease III domain-containing protein [Candidatus Hydrogenedentes bacterium]|nr:endonuclease III domain-containing protein [Candidatus Hydrogenedentota bacterium]